MMMMMVVIDPNVPKNALPAHPNIMAAPAQGRRGEQLIVKHMSQELKGSPSSVEP
jgi:hypothetical protein